MLDGLFFENWLRFYFLEESESDPDEIRFNIPGHVLAKIEAAYPGLAPLAWGLNGKQVDFNASRNALLEYFQNCLATASLPESAALAMLESREFQEKADHFQNWLLLHEATLPELDFAEWKRLFNNWEKRIRVGNTGTW